MANKTIIRPLVAEKSISVSPSLVAVYGFNGAYVIGDVHRWCEFNRQSKPEASHFLDGRWWMRRSYEEWVKACPGLSSWGGVQKMIKRLKADGVLLVRGHRGDKEMWYAVDYDRLMKVLPERLWPEWLKPDQQPAEESTHENLPGEDDIDGDKRDSFEESEDIPSGDIGYLLKESEISTEGVGDINSGDILSIYIEDSNYVPITAPISAAEEPARVNIFALYESNIGLVPQLLVDELIDAEKEFPEDWITDAFKEAVEHNARNWKYIRTILDRWGREGRGRRCAKKIANLTGDDYRRELVAKTTPSDAEQPWLQAMAEPGCRDCHGYGYVSVISTIEDSYWYECDCLSAKALGLDDPEPAEV